MVRKKSLTSEMENSSLTDEELDNSSENVEGVSKPARKSRKKTTKLPTAEFENDITDNGFEEINDSPLKTDNPTDDLKNHEENNDLEKTTVKATETKKSSKTSSSNKKESKKESKEEDEYRPLTHKEQVKLYKQRLREEKKRRKKEDAIRNGDEPKLSDFFKAFENPNKKKRKYFIPQKVKRIKADYQEGLSKEQVKERVDKCQTNEVPNINDKTVLSIIKENVLTFFNILSFAIFGILVAVNIIYKQSWSNIAFMAIILVNMIIGIIQEIRAKMTIEKLSLLTAPSVKVVRDNVETTLHKKKLYLTI